ncbi:Photoactive yellow protein (PYP) [Sorangium cellulosum So ce56]|uniref:Photoactive yellow protein n=1 Tax=Sorangium cellulosum (strain So ce56) TaxID=448385 RepID=A9EV55_SORC5|nr:PAS domain-containing protein [Sorangium cellulosum]CAN91164.1 Photoactive yellow protein (PYP) [Sorangium cellulosum So ce56]
MGSEERSTAGEFEFDIGVFNLDERGLDAQPFGIIRLDREGTVLSYNLYEERQARRNRQDVIGKNFFTDIAPCSRVKAFHGRFLAGVEQRELKATFGFVFHFPHKTRHVDVSLFYKAAARQQDDAVWVFIRG